MPVVWSVIGWQCVAMADPFRILSIDGGGVRGAFSASFLAELERRSGKRIVDHFDLICGTSTGGLLALALAFEHPAARILEFYERDGPRIFPMNKASTLARRARHWYSAKHDGRTLAETLKQLLGQSTKLGQASVRLVIPAFDVDLGRPVCFKTPHHESLTTDLHRAAWEIGMATASAPTYFEPFVSSWGTRYVDGGVWANRPAMVGIVEAVAFLGVPVERIHVLCVGTTGAGYRLGNLVASGKLPWAIGGQPFDMILHANEWAATFQARLLLGDRFREVDYETATPIPMDDCRCVPELRGMGEQAAKERGDAVLRAFFSTPKCGSPLSR